MFSILRSVREDGAIGIWKAGASRNSRLGLCRCNPCRPKTGLGIWTGAGAAQSNAARFSAPAPGRFAAGQLPASPLCTRGAPTETGLLPNGRCPGQMDPERMTRDLAFFEAAARRAGAAPPPSFSRLGQKTRQSIFSASSTMIPSGPRT
jgi:hypothetical protein